MKKRKTVFAVVAVLLGVLALELFLALTGLSKSPSEQLYSDIFNPAYEMVHGVHFPLGNRPDQAWKINRFGFRGPEINQEKSTGTFRIFCVGDSSTAGHFLKYEETYSALLGPHLEGKIPGFRRIEVINAGIPGTAITQHNYTIARKLVNFDPDMILLYCVPNVSQDIIVLRELQRQMAGQKPGFVEGVKRIGRRFHIYRGLRRLMKGDVKAELRSNMELIRASIESGSGFPAKRLELYREDLAQFAALCRAHHITPVLVQNVVGGVVKKLAKDGNLPGTKGYDEYFKSPEAEFIQMTMRFAKENGIAYVNPYERFVPESLQVKLFFDDEVHPNRKGHELLARRIAETILNEAGEGNRYD